MSKNSTSLILVTLLLVSPALGGSFNSGSDGSDGALDCAALFAMNPDCTADCSTPCTVQIALGLAATTTWNTPSPVAGQGVYDPREWAVVYKYTTIDIPAGVTVTFINHPKGAPVVWLASGDVTIAGTVSLNGRGGPTSATYAIPGPGGFSGGVRANGALGPSAGFGPGGGAQEYTAGGSGGYSTHGSTSRDYGSPSIVPLIGGSGGSSNSFYAVNNGAAGGGAILIASTSQITVVSSGRIEANGGDGEEGGGDGSGGAIRLVSNVISGSGSLQAVGGFSTGGFGRIRLEAAVSNTLAIDGVVNPVASENTPGCVFPDASTTPTLRATQVAGKAVPSDPVATVLSEDVRIGTSAPVTLQIEAQNVPIDPLAPPVVVVRVVPAHGDVFFEVSEPLSGNFAFSTTTATIAFPPGNSEVQLLIDVQ